MNNATPFGVFVIAIESKGRRSRRANRQLRSCCVAFEIVYYFFFSPSDRWGHSTPLSLLSQSTRSHFDLELEPEPVVQFLFSAENY